ncbi:MAG TPA: c-type cytochrome, partial [Deltaproteobacteria bacterium]|nr:c-type cytochrome [Deltaproteobacteria bacterium]
MSAANTGSKCARALRWQRWRVKYENCSRSIKKMADRMTAALPARLLVVAALGGVLVALVADPAVAGWGEQEQRGKSVYEQGRATGQVKALLAGPGLEVDAAQFPCVNCHGHDGAGVIEGGVTTADIRPSRLAFAADATRDFGRQRPAYDNEALAMAIRSGLDPGGNSLHPAMPRYRINDDDLADLLAYMRHLGREPVAGVAEDAVRVAALLPSAGPLAAPAREVERVLAAFEEYTNEQGGAYGRRLLLELKHYDPSVDAGGVAAVDELLAGERPFCLLSSMGLGAAALATLEQAGVPLVAPLAVPASDGYGAARNTFFVFTSVADQARVLVDHLVAELPGLGGGAVLLHDSGPEGLAGKLGVESQLSGYDQTLSASIQLAAAGGVESVVAELVAAGTAGQRPSAVFFFADGERAAEFLRLAAAEDWHPLLLGPAERLSPGLAGLPPALLAGLRLVSPAGVPDLDAGRSREFLAVMEREGIAGSYRAFQISAWAGGLLLREGLRRSGRRLTTPRFMASLTGLRGFDTGLLAPLSFDENSRVGVAGATVLRFSTAGP